MFGFCYCDLLNPVSFRLMEFGFWYFFFLMFVQLLLNSGRDLGGDKLTPKFVMECIIGFIFPFEVRLDVSAFGSSSCFT